jgi:hypothetical protein
VPIIAGRLTAPPCAIIGIADSLALAIMLNDAAGHRVDGLPGTAWRAIRISPATALRKEYVVHFAARWHQPTSLDRSRPYVIPF